MDSEHYTLTLYCFNSGELCAQLEPVGVHAQLHTLSPFTRPVITGHSTLHIILLGLQTVSPEH